MALRLNPTLRQRRLGAELRRMREQAGLGGSQLARELGIYPAQVTQMENAKSGISVERLHTIAAVCMCANQQLIDALADIIMDREKGGWWEEYRGEVTIDFAEVAELEAGARRLSTYTTAFAPGLLQTNAYARALFSQTFPPLPPHEIDLRTAFRMRRQDVVRSGKTPYTAYIHEAALRMQFCGPDAHSEQLGSLITDSQRPDISVRIVPFSASFAPSPSENFTYAQGPIAELDTAQMDTGHGIRMFDAPAHLARFRALLDQMDRSALSEEMSRNLIRSIMEEVGSKDA
ncbi:helix-turn-helix transcriptional regulator [Kitasatospora sp. NPDC005856]|uniref:helix-turn-helix domain-containing protein n=1 Tax=Kitasatospora sp. NPDC005856 TaxID=3154566 RepID=UPI0033CE36E3